MVEPFLGTARVQRGTSVIHIKSAIRIVGVRCELEEVAVEQLLRVIAELLREQLHVRFYCLNIRLVRVLAEHLRGQFRGYT